MTLNKKPIRVKPQMFTLFYEHLKVIAIDLGYNLLIHGSMNRDLDLVAVPWVNDPKPELQLIQEFDKYFRGKSYEKIQYYHHSVLPGGRNSYVVNLNRGDKGGEWIGFDEQYYLDISITPLIKEL